MLTQYEVAVRSSPELQRLAWQVQALGRHSGQAHQLCGLEPLGSSLKQRRKITRHDQLFQRVECLQPLRAATPPRGCVRVKHNSAAECRGRLRVAHDEAVARQRADSVVEHELRTAERL
ncbi:MAG: hypothetical protein WCB10_10975 [Steroidobacteraceae bacterium]